MEYTDVRTMVGRIAAYVEVIAISIALVFFVASYGKMWPQYIQSAFLLGMGLVMYALSLYKYHTKWGKYFHAPLLLIGVLFMLPIGIGEMTSSWDSLNPSLTLFWDMRSGLLVVLMISQLMLCIAAWFYCKSTASLAGIIYSTSVLYLWAINRVTPYIISTFHLNTTPEFVRLCGSLLLYLTLFALSYTLRNRSYTLAFITRCIAVFLGGVRIFQFLWLMYLTSTNGLWLYLWLVANGFLFAFGLRMRDYAIVVGTVLSFVVFLSLMIYK